MTDKEFEVALATALQAVLEGRPPDFDALAPAREDRRRLERAIDCVLRHGAAPPEVVGLRQLGPYRLERELGRGGMGVVYLGTHVTLGRTAAIKVLPLPFAMMPTYRERFRREAMAMARVSHPYVLPIFEVGEQDGTPFAALAYAERGTLADLLRTAGSQDVARARRRCTQILGATCEYEREIARRLAGVAAALQKVHDAGVVHRDVKASNLLRDRDGTVYLGDFGLALHQELPELTRTGEVVGTRRYLAPELTCRGAEATPLSDVYSLGATLYEMVAFQPPFHAATEEALLRDIRGREPRRPSACNPWVPRELDSICLKAIEKHPSRRYQSAAALAADLAACADRRPVSAEPPGMRRLGRIAWFHRRAVGMSLLIVLTVIAAVSIGVGWLEQQRTAEEAEFVRAFRTGESLLVRDGPFPGREVRLVQALDAFRRCTRLRPSRPEPVLRVAEVALRLGRQDEAAASLEEAERLGLHGPGVHRLRGRMAPHVSSEPAPQAAANRGAYGTWAAIDQYDLAYSHYRAGNLRDAYEILSDLLLERNPLLCPDILLAVCLHKSVTWKASPQILVDTATTWRLALAAYNRSLADLPDSPVLLFNKAILVRDALADGIDLGVDAASTLGWAEQVLERLWRQDRDAAAKYQWLGCLWVRVLLRLDAAAAVAIALPQLQAFSDHEVLALDDDGFEFARNLLIATRSYQRAFDLMRRRIGPEADPESLVDRITEVFRKTVQTGDPEEAVAKLRGVLALPGGADVRHAPASRAMESPGVPGHR